MATMGPEDRERFARRDEAGVPLSSARRDLEPEREKSVKAVAGGSISEAVLGAATVVLAIIALAGTTNAGFLASIATIVFGVALIAHGGAIAARFRQLLRETTPYELDTRTELGGGMGAELIGGATGIVLGILALLGVGSAVLIPIAIIVFGGAVLLGSGANADLSTLSVHTTHPRIADIARQAAMAASGTQALVGLGAIVLGILALVGLDPVVLTLVALLVLGGALVLSGTAMSTRMAAFIRR